MYDSDLVTDMDYLNTAVCVNGKQIVPGPLEKEEIAALWQLLGKFCSGCRSMGEQMEVIRIRLMVADLLEKEVQNHAV